ncbi:OLC1v1035458C1 [Oldenlandia corymbosa var. corymbosa]|uniref:OLC1v1035458C1 n=1 Tax=Oldenlandia corymbosa var. corymbosa TaxID=529605 RepID=A0AAV1CT17_OLDCO|nr:OLC1v1035458C1 [Oldenlandia corymbosa var. corymbosa]
MGSPERARISGKKDNEVDSDVKLERFKDDDEWIEDDKKKHRTSKSRRPGIDDEEVEGVDGSGRKKAGESRKRSSGSARADSDEDDFDTTNDSLSRHAKKRTEGNTLDRLNNRYQEEEFLERREGSRERGHGSSEHGKTSKRRWDDSDVAWRGEDSNYVDKSDVRVRRLIESKRDNFRVKTDAPVIDQNESQTRESGATVEKFIMTQELQDKNSDPESINRERFDASVEEFKATSFKREEHSQQKNSAGGDNVDSHDRSINVDEDSNAWMRDKSRRDIDTSRRSRSPERNGRRNHELDTSDIDYERSNSFRRKEQDRDSYRDDRSKAREESWNDRSRDREGSREGWKRRQPNNVDKEVKDINTGYDHVRDWDVPRRGRMDHERPQGRSGGRKDGNRTEAVKTSSKYGISNDNYDVIEIQTKPFDYGKEDSKTILPRSNGLPPLSDTLNVTDEENAPPKEERARNLHVSALSAEEANDTLIDENDYPAGKARSLKVGMLNRVSGNQSSGGGTQMLHGNEENSSVRSGLQGVKGNRVRARGRPTGRDGQQVGLPMTMMASPFAPLGMPPPGSLQSLTPSMSPAPATPMSPAVFMSPFQPPVIWPGGRGIDMNLLAVPPVLSHVPPGHSVPRFPPNIGTSPNAPMYFNQAGPRVGPPNVPAPGFNPVVPSGRGQPPQDKTSGGWVPPRSGVPPGKAPSRGEQNDYSQNFVDTGERPQNFIRELELTSVVEDYPKLRELIQKKDEIVAKSNSPPLYLKCDLREQVLSPEVFGTKFDVILVDPPWEEYVHRAPGVTDHMEYWTIEEIMNLKIEAVADTPSFIFLWVGDGVGLEQGRQCLKKWGFRRCEDICWVKTNKTNATPGLRHDSHTLFQRSKEHCLMGIKGTVRRSTDGHIIHANIDTDVIIAEEPPYGSTAKPEDMYRIIEHFALGRRRLELFGEDHNIRPGWLTVGKGLSSSNFNAEAYCRSFADKDGKVWQGGGGRNPPPEAPHLVLTTPDIEALRPKSPMKNQQQLQPQSSSISLTTGNSSNRRPAGNSPQNNSTPSMNQEASSSNIPNPRSWVSPMEGFKGREGGPMPPEMFDMYGYNASFGPNAEFLEYESQRAMNMLQHNAPF